MAFNRETTTEEAIAGVDLRGRTAVITGASAGLGIETSRALAGAGARVAMVARDLSKLEAAVRGIRDVLPQADIETERMDLADLASVRAAAGRLADRFPEIHLLINNAGVMACPLGRTAEGFELQFGTNHLGHFLFTCLLVPSLRAGAPARVVNLSSAGHRLSGVDFEDPNYLERDYDKWEAYGQSKSANALFAVALDKRLADEGVRAFSVHPGMIVTELGRHLDRADIEALQARARQAGQTAGMKSIPAGAATTVWAATSSELEDRGGLYLEDCRIAEPEAPGVSGGYCAHAVDPEAAERLWSLSEELIGERFAPGR